MATVTSATSSDQIFEQMEHYPWTEDAEFQGGLTAILGPSPSPEQAQELTLRARCFYYARKYEVPVDFSAYKQWRLQHNSSAVETLPTRNTINGTSTITESSNDTVTSTSSPANPPAPYPPTFSQIVDLITTGQPIPGIKDIPDTILVGQETQPTTAKRKKPWEKAEAEPKADLEGDEGFDKETV